jgi:hypothetical protein
LLLIELIKILPGFYNHWNSKDNCFRRDDGSFTLCGVFTDCSHYIHDDYAEILPSERRKLGEFISRCMVEVGTDLDTTAATCFLENLAFEPFSGDLEACLTGEALDFFPPISGAIMRAARMTRVRFLPRGAM